MEDRVMKYQAPKMNVFCGWDSEFAVGGSPVIPDTCDDGSYEEPA